MTTYHEYITFPDGPILTGVSIDPGPVYTYLAADNMTVEFRQPPAELAKVLRELADRLDNTNHHHETGDH